MQRMSNGPRVYLMDLKGLSGPKTVPNDQVYLRAILKMNEKPKSKLGLPRVTIRGQIIPQPKSLR